MALFSVAGLSTGIDTKTLIEQLIAGERAPARLVEQNRSTAQTRLNAIQTMNTKMLAVRDAMDAVRNSDSFKGRKASSSNESAVGVSASAAAVPGNVVINVTALASAQQYATEPALVGIAASDSLGASGEIFLRSGGATQDTTIPVTDFSLNGIASAINNANAGASAAVVNDGTGLRLLVTSTKSGADNGIVTLSGTGDLGAVLPGTFAMKQVSAAKNAEIIIGNPDDPQTNLVIQSATNQTDQVVPGVTLNLKALASNVQIGVSQDNGGAASKVQTLVDAMNDARTYFQDNSKYDTTTKRSGALFNDYEVPRQLDILERELTKSFSTQPAGTQAVADVGLTVDGDGKFTFDQTKFNARLATDERSVAGLFIAAGSAASAPLDSLTKSVTGTLTSKKISLEDSITAFTARIADIDARLEKRRAFYEAKFLQMEQLSAKYKSQGNQISGISGFSK